MLTKDLQEVVKQLVLDTKPLILREMENAKVTVKGAANYVTNVDYAVQNYLKEKLEKYFPDILLIAEEKENQNLSENERYWILDPIDGTTNLIHDYKLSSVALGLYEHGEITFGVVYNPFQDELYSAAKGEGAFLNEKPIQVSGTENFGDALISYGSSPYEKEIYGERLFKIYKEIYMRCSDFRRCGSAELDICHVACGRIDAYFELNLKPWDYTAGSIILKEAGGEIFLLETEAPYLKNADVLACAPQFTGILKKIICEA